VQKAAIRRPYCALPVVLLLLICIAAGAQNYDVLATSPHASIYLETEHTGNDGLANCDWYTAADAFLAADPASDFGTGCQVSLRIRGTISRDSAAEFSSIVERLATLEMNVASIVLDSRGGDADAAISMARLIRQSNAFIAVPVVARIAEDYQSVCFSACVVLFSAAYKHELEFNIDDNPDLPSRIGIHGPGQFDRTQSAYDTSAGNSEIARVGRRLKDYFRSIDVAERLVDDMFAVPFDQIRLLTRDELVGYGLYAD
jgi:hypothetical protein